jgi:hypothetical protein
MWRVSDCGMKSDRRSRTGPNDVTANQPAKTHLSADLSADFSIQGGRWRALAELAGIIDVMTWYKSCRLFDEMTTHHLVGKVRA